MDDNKISNRRKEPRNRIQTNVEFYILADIVKAKTVNISDTGVRFDTEKALDIEMRFKKDGKEEDHTARLCWAEQLPDGSFTYGFEFID